MTGLKHNGCSTCNLQGGKVEYVGENDYLCIDIPPCGSLCLTIKEGAQLADRNKIYSTQIMTCPIQTKLGQYKQGLGQQKQELGLHKQGLIQQQLYGKSKIKEET